MAKVTIKATKMLNADASHISLVDRGANRIPFKIVKQEKRMGNFLAPLDLTRMFARKSEAPVAEVVGVAAMSGATLAAVKKQLEEVGFDISNVIKMEDESVVFKQEAEPEGQGTVVRVTDDVALVLKNFKPHDMDIQVGGQSFTDHVAEMGYYPAVSSVMKDLGDAVAEVVTKAESSTDAAELVAKMFDEAKLYATTMIGALPVTAFKLEALGPIQKGMPVGGESDTAKPGTENVDHGSLDDGVVSDDDSGADDSKTPLKNPLLNKGSLDPTSSAGASGGKAKQVSPIGLGVGINTEKAADPKKPMADSDDPASEAAEREGEPTSGDAGGDSDDDVPPAAKNGKPKTSDGSVTKADLAALTKQMKDMMHSISKSVIDIGEKVETAVETAKKAEAKIKGVVINGSDNADHVPTRKSESAGYGREIDTGYMSRAQRQAMRRQ